MFCEIDLTLNSVSYITLTEQIKSTFLFPINDIEINLDIFKSILHQRLLFTTIFPHPKSIVIMYSMPIL